MTITDTVRAEEFMRAYEPCHRPLYAYIVMLVGDPAAAADILQDTNLVLWQKFGEFEPGSNFFAFAHEIARYRVLRYRQIQSRVPALLEAAALESIAESAATDDSQGDRAYHEALAGCLGKLNAADAELIRCRYEPGVRVKRLAERFARSENALSQSLARIRRTLRACIEKTLSCGSTEGAP